MSPVTTELCEALRRAFAGQYEVEGPLGAGGMGRVFLSARLPARERGLVEA